MGLRVREPDRTRDLAVVFELALALGIAGPKKSVAELVNLLIGALDTGTGTSACGVGIGAFENVGACGC